MRFPVLLATGLGFIAIGIALSEYARRHPPTPDEAKTAKTGDPETTKTDDGTPAPKPALTPEELISRRNLVYDAPTTEAMGAAGSHLEALTQAGKSASGLPAHALLAGDLTAKGLISVKGGVAFWMEDVGGVSASKSTHHSLVWLGATSQVLATGRTRVGNITGDDKRLVWAEEGRLLSVTLDSPQVKGLMEFTKARIVDVCSNGDDVLAVLSPADLDPFSTEPSSVLVSISTGREVKVLAKDLIRPQELRCDNDHAFLIAGYPAALQSITLADGALKTLDERAQSPLAISEGRAVFRRGGDAPALLTVTIADGTEQTAAKADSEHLAVDGAQLVYGNVNAVERVDLVSGKSATLLELPSPAVELALHGNTAYVLTRAESGGQVLLAKPLPKGK